jgi:hypothetical protein
MMVQIFSRVLLLLFVHLYDDDSTYISEATRVVIIKTFLFIRKIKMDKIEYHLSSGCLK